MNNFKSFLKEEASSVLYHGTSLENAISILHDGMLRKSNSKSRYHDGVEGIACTRSLKRAGDYGVVFILPRDRLKDLMLKNHVNAAGNMHYPEGEEEEKIILPRDVNGIHIAKYVSGFKLENNYVNPTNGSSFHRFSPRGPKRSKMIEELLKHPLYKGTYRG